MNEINDRILTKDEYILKESADGAKITVRDLQLEILPIMDEIHRICVKHNVAYGLMAGSALGIYNYKGFIPWDDDIDVCVLRSDWEKFVDAMKKELSPEFYFQCFATDPNYNVLIPTMKVRKRGTYIKEVNFLLKNKCKSGDGVFVDVIIYDSISVNKLQDEIYRSIIKVLMLPMVLLDNIGINPVFLKKAVTSIANHYSRINEDSSLISQQVIIPWEKFLKEPVFLKSDVYPFKQYEFEGRYYYSYRNPEAILKQWYGPNCLRKWDGEKWVETLPVEKRKPKHIADLDLNHEHLK